MNDTTLTPHCMPRTTAHQPEELTVSDQPTRIKLYDQDHTEAQAILLEAQKLNRTCTLHEVLREALHAGLPVVARKYAAAINAIERTT